MADAAVLIAIEEEEQGKRCAAFVRNIVHSPWWDPKEILSQPVSLPKAYTLVWQNDKTGDVEGRKSSSEAKVGLVGLCMLELVAMGKISVTCEDTPRLNILDPTLTETYLDKAIFEEMIKRDHRKKDKNGNGERLRKAAEHFQNKTHVADGVLNCLVEEGTLTFEKHTFRGNKYPTANPEPENWVKSQLNTLVANNGTNVDLYMRCLVSAFRMAEKNMFTNPLTKADTEDGSAAKEVFSRIYEEVKKKEPTFAGV